MQSPLLAFLITIGISGLIVVATQDEPWTPMEECRRPCDGIPKHCYMKLHIERYSVLGPACRKCDEGIIKDCYRQQCVTADGYKRAMISANRQLPSPPIEVCRNDNLTVDVINMMPDESTSIHWHGLRLLGTPYADGVPYVTQCPIPPAATFRYNFTANEAGTFFYHSHTSTQKVDGLSGALIVRDIKSNDVHANLYDKDLSEHTLFIADWTHVPAEHLVPGLNNDVQQVPSSYLINGKGQYYDQATNIQLPREEIEVEKGLRYRFRLIGGVCLTCAVSISFQGHRVTAISADGGLAFNPIEVDTVFLNSADRFDVILNANNKEGKYAVTLRGVGSDCKGITYSTILRYKNATASAIKPANNDPKPNYGVVFNDVTSKCDGSSPFEICMNNLKGTTDAPQIKSSDMYQQIQLDLNFYFSTADELFQKGSYIIYDEPKKGVLGKPHINYISFAAPPSPLLSQFEDIPEDAFCDDKCKQGNSSTLCVCAIAYNVKLNSVVDLILTDRDAMFAHPFHLHGHNFYIMEMKGGILDLDEELNSLKERLRTDQISHSNKPQRDSVNVPHSGYTAVRFIADNPGYWIYHCHFAFHLEGGMGGVLKVGEDKDFPPVPKNFPRCSNFL